MRCPKCGTQNPAEVWNCVGCRINLYWVSQHYDDLAELTEQQGRSEPVSSPTFLLRAHRHAMDDRAARGHDVDNKVRIAARKAMHRTRSEADDGGT